MIPLLVGGIFAGRVPWIVLVTLLGILPGRLLAAAMEATARLLN